MTPFLRFLFRVEILLGLAPVALVLKLMGGPALGVFFASALAIVPLAAWMGRATEVLAERAGAALSAFLNATFGNAAELIIALMALKAGYTTLVKASITGALLGNLLLVVGGSMAVGGLRHPIQRFDAVTAGAQSTLMLLAVMALFLPAIFHHLQHASSRLVLDLSTEISVILLVVYAFSLLFTLRTHAHLVHHEAPGGAPAWSARKALLILLVSVLGVVILSEWMVHALEGTLKALGWSEFFVGVVVVALIGNVAEHTAAFFMAHRNQMDVALGIGLGSSVQIALFVAPLLVIVARLAGWRMDLLFDPLEIVTVGLAVLGIHSVAHDGQSHWLEGVMLLAAYGIFATGFFFWHPA